MTIGIPTILLSYSVSRLRNRMTTMKYKYKYKYNDNDNDNNNDNYHGRIRTKKAVGRMWCVMGVCCWCSDALMPLMPLMEVLLWMRSHDNYHNDIHTARMLWQTPRSTAVQYCVWQLLCFHPSIHHKSTNNTNTKTHTNTTNSNAYLQKVSIPRICIVCWQQTMLECWRWDFEISVQLVP